MMKLLLAILAAALLFAAAAIFAPARVFASNESAATWIGLAPGNWSVYSSAAAENNNVAKASQATLGFMCYTNQTTTDLLMQVFNSTTVPVDGAVTPAACAPVPAASATLVKSGCVAPPMPMNFTTGISMAISTGVNCFNKATPGPSSGMFWGQFK